MHNRKDIYLRGFYILVSFFWFFAGMSGFQASSWRYDSSDVEHLDIINWQPVLATIFVFAGWGGGCLTAVAKTTKGKLLVYLAAVGVWLFLMVTVAIGLGFDGTNVLRSPGVDVALGLASFIFAGYFLSVSRRSA